MKTKKNLSLPHVKQSASYFKAEGQKKVIIEGMANVAVPDRGKELIPGKVWNLDNFQKNPILFFNHDRNFPIGKVVGTKVTDKGLEARAEISNSKDPEISKIRDLVKEGILKTFSVGFDAKEQPESDKSGNLVFKDAELLELSVVTIPMNQESTFSVTQKSFKTKSLNELKVDILNEKGAWVAGAIQNQIFDLQSQESDFDKEAALAQIAEVAEISREELNNVLLGDITPVPPKVLFAISDTLGLTREDLEKLDKGDQELVSEVQEEPKAEDEEEAEGSEDEKPLESEDSEDEGEEPKPEEDEDDKEKGAFEDCVSEKIPKLLQDGKGQNEAVASAIEMCSKEKGCSIESITKANVAKWIKFAETLSKQAEQEGVDNDSSGNVDRAPDSSDLGDPHLEVAKQTNVLLGVLINEIQILNSKIDEKQPVEEAPEVEEEVQEEPKQDVADLDESAEDKESEEDDDELKAKKLQYIKYATDVATKIFDSCTD